LYNDIFDTAEEMDAAVEALVGRLLASSSEAMKGLKKVFWEGTEHWDELLAERAAISGELILSEEAKAAINKFKSK
jgi:methylglutaconyl-CoA hydratase